MFSGKMPIFAHTMSKRREKNKPQPTLNRQLEQPEAREKEKNESLIELGKLCYSTAQLIFGSSVLNFILDFTEDRLTALIVGVLSTAFLIFLGWGFIKRGNIKK